MESLAMLIVTLLFAMLISTVIAIIMAVRSRKLGVRVAAMVVGMPGAYIGTMLLLNAGSLGGRIFGAIGIFGCVFPAWRMYQAMRTESFD